MTHDQPFPVTLPTPLSSLSVVHPVVDRINVDRRESVTSHVGGIVLSGVQRWGACELEDVVPRVLTPVLNRPLISHLLDWLMASGIGHVSVCSKSCTS